MDKVQLKFIALNQEITTAEEMFTVRQLKEKYPKLWLKSNQDYQILLISVWRGGQQVKRI